MARKGMKSSLRPKARPSSKLAPRASMRPKARPIDVSPKAERGDIELMLKEQEEKSRLRPTRDGKAMTTKSYLQPRADGTGLTTDPENMKYGGKVKKMRNGGKVRGAGMAKKGVRPCKMR